MSLRTVRILLWLPLVTFLIVLGLVSSGLVAPHDRTIVSQMVGRRLPSFDLPSGRPGEPPITSASFVDGKPHLVNFFGSWCVPCITESPELAALRQAGVPIVGIALRDKPDDLAAFLRRNGDPYERIARDDSAAVQVALGSTGVPETFLVDGRGIVRGQYIGPIGPQDLAAVIAAVKAAR